MKALDLLISEFMEHGDANQDEWFRLVRHAVKQMSPVQLRALEFATADLVRAIDREVADRHWRNETTT